MSWRETAVCVCSGVVFAFGGAVLAGENMLSNAGFENVDKDGTPAGWRTSEPSTISVTSDAREGKNSCCVDIREEPKWTDRINRAHLTQNVQLKPGRYMYTGMIRGQNVCDLLVNFTVQEKGKRRTITHRLLMPENFPWRPFQFIFSVPATADKPVTSINLWFFGLRGKRCMAFVDDLKLTTTTHVRNYVTNSGFEITSIPHIPDYWRNNCRQLMDRKRYDAYVDTSQAVSGKQSLCLKFDTENLVSQARSRNRLISMYVRPEIGRTYTFSAYMKADTPGAFVQMGGGSARKDAELTTEWKRYSCTGTWIKEASAKAYVYFYISRKHIGKPLRAHIWIDDVQAEEGETVSSYTPAPEDAVMLAQQAKAAPLVVSVSRPPSLAVKRISRAPRLDGALDDACWKGVDEARSFVGYQNNERATDQTRVKLAYDDHALYLAFVCDSAAAPKADETNRDGVSIFSDDVFEFFFDPNQKDTVYYHWGWNAKGTVFDEKISYDVRVLTVVGGTGRIQDTSWNPACEVRTRVFEGGWSGEVRIPLFYFAGELEDKPVSTVNFGRENPAAGEITCWSYTKGQFHAPLRFGTLSGLRPDVSRYALSLGEPHFATDVLKKALVGSFAVQKAPGELVGFKLRYQGKESFDVPVAFEQGQVTFAIPSEKAVDGDEILLSAFAKDGRPLMEQAYKVTVPPMLAFACGSLAFQDEKRIPCVVELNLPRKAIRHVRMALVLRGNHVEQTVHVRPGRGRKRIDFSFRNVADGYYKLACRLEGRDGTLIAEQVRDVAIEPRREQYVRLVPESVTFDKSGKPIFPMALGFVYSAHFDELKAHGFNTVWYSPFGTYNPYFVEVEQYMAAARRAGMNLIINFGPMLRYSDRMKLDKAAIQKKIHDFVETYRDHPSILMYQVLDEPNVQRGRKRPFSSKEELFEMHWFVKREDPYRPVFVNWGPSVRVWHDLSYTDVMAYDYYSTPVSPTERTIERHNYFDDHALRRARETGKLFFKWMECNHGCTELGIRLMRPVEQRCVSFLSIVNGVRALSYFHSRPWNDGVWEEMTRIGAEVREMTPVLAADDTPAIARSSDDAVRVLLKHHEGKYYLFAVNSSAKDKTVTVRFLKDRFASDEEALFSRAPRVREMKRRGRGDFRDGVFTLSLEGYGMRIFKITPRRDQGQSRGHL